MTLSEALAILGDDVQLDGSLDNTRRYLHWSPTHGDVATLDSGFTADELEAVAVYMRAHSTARLGEKERGRNGA